MKDQMQRIDGAIGGARIALVHLRTEINVMVSLGEEMAVALDAIKSLSNGADDKAAEEDEEKKEELFTEDHRPTPFKIPEGITPDNAAGNSEATN